MQSLTWSEIVDAPCPGRRTSRPLDATLAAVVHTLENAFGRPAGAARWRTPSAGGIYPYEVFVATEDSPRLVAHVDLHRRVVTTSQETAASMADADGFLFALCGRPWLSMRAYGRRGFLYHVIDLGHAMCNAALLCGGGDADATRGVKHFANAIGAISPTAQIACIDRVRAGTEVRNGSDWQHHVVHTGQTLPYRSEYEALHAGALNPASRERLRKLTGPHVLSLRELVGERKSAKRFHASDAADERIAGLLERLPELLASTATDLGLPVSGMRVLPPDVRAELIPTVRDATAALAQQEHLARARAYVVFGLDQNPNRSIDRSARRQLLSIGTASELIYLEAARAGVAVTGVGGIDSGIWREITGFDMPLYLVALGVEHDEPAPTVRKLDRLNVVA